MWKATPGFAFIFLESRNVMISQGMGRKVLGRWHLALVAACSGLSLANPIISEFAASPAEGLVDSDGDASDWIELSNHESDSVDLSGYYLSDDVATPTKWQFPEGVMLSADGYLLVFASGKDRVSPVEELHTNFRLASGGESLGLFAPDGVTVVHEYQPSYPRQFSGVSYGINGDSEGYFNHPSPGEANTPLSYIGIVADTRFSVDRGFFDDPIQVDITTSTEGAAIYYTTDGSKPDLGTIFSGPNGTLVEGPVVIDKTTVLRAAAFKDDFQPSNTDTQSYIFIEDVIRQPDQPEGAPERWGTRVTDYEMDPRVVDDTAYSKDLRKGFQDIRSMSLVVESDDFFGRSDGIYANPQQDGREWEREISMELINPDGSPGFQIDCGIRIHGNGSRSPGGQPKHGFRVEFRGDYGEGTLKYPLFPESPVTEFDNLILRSQNAHGWTRSSQISNNVGTSEREQSQYIRDSFARDLHTAMGHQGGEATFVHLFINGLYWGLYNPVEYPREFHGEQHFGGSPEDYDSINRRPVANGGKGSHAIDGTKDAWAAMQELADSGLETPEKLAAMQEHMDLDNLIDYMLVHQYLGSRDGPEVFHSNNMRALRRTRGETPGQWQCYLWDMEASMFEINVTRNINVDDPDTLVRVYTKLRENPEFLMRYGDHVHRHFFNDGIMTPGPAAALWEKRAREIFNAIVGESARWGDFRRSSRPFTRDAEWMDERMRLLNEYFPSRARFLVREFKENGLYPETIAPHFNQHGGEVEAGFILTMEAGTIFSPQPGNFYYTLDGTDPRLPGGGLSASAILNESGVALTTSTTVKVRLRDGDAWSALNEAFFYVDALPASGDNIVISEIMYHPAEESDAEYIELQNMSDQRVHLRGLHLQRVGGEGVEFSFDQSELAPGEVLLVVRDPEAFARAHGDDVALEGVWSGGSLSNNGETITLKHNRTTLSIIHYNDSNSWPVEADGQGMSLTRNGSEWQASVPSPGVTTPSQGPPPETFRISSITRTEGMVLIQWPMVEGATDQVEFSQTLDGIWEVREMLSSSEGLFEEAIGRSGDGFYRVVRTPTP